MEAYDGWGKRKKRPPKIERRKDKLKRHDHDFGDAHSGWMLVR